MIQFYLQYTLLFGSILILTLNACCTKKDCDDANGFQRITFNNFDSDDLDSVMILTFEQGTDFTICIDTQLINIDTSNYAQGYIINDSYSLPFSYDYQVLLKTNTRYSIQHFKLSKEKCNTCLLGINQDYSYALSEYSVNGSIIESAFIKINK